MCFLFLAQRMAEGDAFCCLREKYLSHLDAGSTHKAAPLCCWPLSCTTRAGGCLGSPLNGFSAVILESIDFMFCIFPRLCMWINDWQLHQEHCPHSAPPPNIWCSKLFPPSAEGNLFFPSRFQIVCISSFEHSQIPLLLSDPYSLS